MLDNLINTWQLLAPNEIDSGPDEMNVVIFVINCLKKRGWSWSLSCDSGVEFTATVEDDRQRVFETNPYQTSIEALLTAYLEALAGNRPIKKGAHWQHYKGDLVEVVATAKWGGAVRFRDDFPSLGDFVLEEGFYPPVELVETASGTCLYISHANRNYGERIFYQHDSNNWARPIGDFLGLTDDGRLRFVEGNHEKST